LNKNVANLPNTKFLDLLVADIVTWNNNMDQLISILNSACYAVRDINAMFSRKG
jgi:hypothetical protein